MKARLMVEMRRGVFTVGVDEAGKQFGIDTRSGWICVRHDAM